MTRIRPILALLTLLALPGCGAWPLLRQAITGEVQLPPPPPVVCVAQYHLEYEPGWDLGSDGCGNTWGRRRSDQTCWIEFQPGIVQQIQCPVAGDTLSVVDPRAN